MNIDFTQTLLDPVGKPMKTTEPDDNGEPVIVDLDLRRVALDGLWKTLPGDDKLPAADLIKCARLAQKIASAEVVFLTVDERKLCKDRIEKAWRHPGILMRAFDMLDPPEQEAGAPARESVD